jgi:hypothetical protein
VHDVRVHLHFHLFSPSVFALIPPHPVHAGKTTDVDASLSAISEKNTKSGWAPFRMYLRNIFALASPDGKPHLQVSGRRVQAIGGHVHERSGRLLPAPLPGWALPVLERIASDTGVFPNGPPNHILLNAYPIDGGKALAVPSSVGLSTL